MSMMAVAFNLFGGVEFPFPLKGALYDYDIFIVHVLGRMHKIIFFGERRGSIAA